jgi:hypothetical protein
MNYRFELQGHLDRRWATVFDGFAIAHGYAQDGGPITVLTGPVADQSALYGLVGRLRDLGAALISVQPDDPREAPD